MIMMIMMIMMIIMILIVITLSSTHLSLPVGRLVLAFVRAGDMTTGTSEGG